MICFVSCKSDSATVATFCDTSCLKDSIKFIKSEHPYQPYLYISAKNCAADSITWSYMDLGVNRKMSLKDLVGTDVKLNSKAVGCFIQDTSFALVYFNDCETGRGISIKLPYAQGGKKQSIVSALTKFDPKFSIADNLLVYSDRGNLFVEDMATGKKDNITFGERVEIDYDHLHDYIDSVNVTPTTIWAKVKIGKEWKELDKKISLK